MQPALLDASVYISALRRGDSAVLTLRRLAVDRPLWLSAVVLEELYAGSAASSRPAVDRLERDFDGIKRILLPNLRDWSQAGKLLARLAARHGYEQIGKGRLTNDALIATSAARLGIEVITTNARDFSRLAEFHSFQWQVATI